MIDSSEYQNVTYSQIDKMKHTIGFSNQKIRGTKHRKYEPYRNYYCAGKTGDIELDVLVKIGFMDKNDSNYYWVTDNGRLFLQFVTGVEILPESD